MRVWTDVFSGDEMVSDSYKHQLIFNDACLEVQCKYITVGGAEEVDIGAGNAFGGGEEEAGGDDGGTTAINVVHAQQLSETSFSKKDCMALLKGFLKKTVEHLKEKGKDDRIPEFKKGATEMIKMIMEKFDEMQIFTGQSCDPEASLAFSYTKDGEEEPVIMFFNDALKEEKF